ncbi:MAG: sugar transferase [Candidatus Actinomarinales bacterium]|nr:MAG: sugar transferase [Candidatus Actinomarinales bacterium]|tara:strand:- start:300 stop:917 length:618 start_codon:yes stop_codon:yes gene_type:complete
MKNITDITITIFVLPILLVVIPIIYLFILISDGYPAIYKQERVGKNGKIFTLYKFRTMDHSSDENIHEEHYKNLTKAQTVEPSLTPGNPIRIENDDRITKIGQFLRKTSLDELPNLFNVLFGEMSIVGPRPLVKYESDLLGEYQKERHSVKPGITGLAQTQGRLDLSLQERLYWDLDYVKKYNLVLDLKIIFQTVMSVISRKGAN